MVLFASVVVAVVLFVVLFFLGVSAASDLSAVHRRVPSAATMLAGARDVQLTTSDGLRLGGVVRPGAPPGLYIHGSGC